jgi:hypothetical protein
VAVAVTASDEAVALTARQASGLVSAAAAVCSAVIFTLTAW